jgi:DNA-directed RNA polymerase subunit omega
MIHPSYVDLMAVVNKDVEEGETPVINSRYSIVMATAKRARQIVDGDESLVKVSRGEKPLSIAVDELNQGEIRILAEDEVEEDFIGNEETAADADEGAEMIAEDAAADAEDSAAEDEILPEEEMTVEEEAGEAEE